MEAIQHRWILRKGKEEEKLSFLSQKWGLSSLLVKLLLNREVKESEFEEYLHPSFAQLHDPFLMQGMDRAVERIILALKQGEKLLIYGDYDVDGITATSLLLRFLRDLKFSPYYYIPHRQSEGYGLNPEAIKKAFRKNIKVIITCDCGTSSREEIKFARSLGLEVIVTDHHRVGKLPPQDFILLNPHQPNCRYPFKELAGVGVVFKLCQALSKELNFPLERLKAYLDLVALGTLADIVILQGENRTLVKLGLDRLCTSTTPLGLRALISIVGLSGRKIGEKEAAYILTPRLNACGRLSLAKVAVKLLLTEISQEALFLARRLDKENSHRQNLEKKMCQEAEKILPQRIKQVLVVAKKNWHLGVIGLVASYIKDKYYRPTLVFSIEGDEARGSARSIPGFSIFEALERCKHLITSFGGHKMAAGLTLPCRNIPFLEEELNLLAGKLLSPEDFIPSQFFDARLDLEALSPELLQELELLAPFGSGNPAPLFLAPGTKVISSQTINRGIKFILSGPQNKGEFEAVSFDFLPEKGKIFPGQILDILYVPLLKKWRGKYRIQLEIKDWRKI